MTEQLNEKNDVLETAKTIINLTDDIVEPEYNKRHFRKRPEKWEQYFTGSERMIERITKSYVIKETSIQEGVCIAKKIQQELCDFWTKNSAVEKELMKVNSQNAYTFIEKMLEVSDENTVFRCLYKRVSSSAINHVVLALLYQAKCIGLENEFAYQTLLDTYRFIKRQYINKEAKKVVYDKLDIEQIDMQVRHLYNKMSKLYL